ncbi:MAG: FIST C-terminal domain-containing protein [Treponema sp.]|jgi:hypothetical protein|nr:FIST C-terminal domain-containing protein [Treponema sp.]
MMKSAVAVSYELDDPLGCAQELAASVRERLVFEKNSIGFLLCDADCDGAALTGELKKILGIEVAGMTSLAALDKEGRQEAAVVLMVLTAGDCFFSPAVSAPLGEGDAAGKITGAYKASAAAAAGYGEKAALIFAFCPLGMPFSGDIYPEIFSGASGNVPVIGGICSDDYDYARARTFLSGGEYRDALVMVSVWGNVKPVFSLRHVTSKFAERTRRVSSARGNVVKRVGDETFVEYLKSFGLNTDIEEAALSFTSYPVMLTREGQDETPLMRHILSLNKEDGSGSFFGDVPEGTLANVCLVNKKDITASCGESMQYLLEEAGKQGGYEYSSIFCFSCCGRAMILGADSNAEGSIIRDLIPPGLALAGSYCLGEICPVKYRGGEAVNRFHNCSITFCML